MGSQRRAPLLGRYTSAILPLLSILSIQHSCLAAPLEYHLKLRQQAIASASNSVPLPVLAPGQDTSNAQSFIVYNADTVHYPFTVHPPDRQTRGLAPLDGPPPLLLSLSGSGARGPASEAKILSGYDGASRKIRQYNEGNRSAAHCLAAEEFLTVTPICPNETSQADANWDVTVLPNILAQVSAAYEVDLTRVYLSTYSMGARAAWGLLMANPNIFAGSIISSGTTYANARLLSTLLGNSIRNYYGEDDEPGLSNQTLITQATWNAADAVAIRTKKTNSTIYSTRVLETIGPIPDADHLTMTDRPWDEDVMTDGYGGALAWLLTQTRPEGAILTYNGTVCTDCGPPS